VSVGLLAVRALAGGAVGIISFFGFLESRVDAWVPILAGSIMASAGVAALHVGARASHYTAWITRPADGPRGVAAYVLIQTLLGLPVVAIAAFVVWAATFGLLVAP
jgi:hypothetical protein